MSDRFDIQKFHHLEFYCLDATNVSRRFTWGFGLKEVAKSDLSTGNKVYASYVLQSNEIVFAFTAPYNHPLSTEDSNTPHPGYSSEFARHFIINHGLAVRAIGIKVGDAREAFHKSVENDAVAVMAPHDLVDKKTGKVLTISEVKMADDLVMRFVSGDYDGPYLPNYEGVSGPDINYGLTRIDHCVTNVPSLFDAVDYICKYTGFHEFGEFTAADVGTVDSGLNSMVLANNSEYVILPVNEPTHGTKRKSQIQMFLEHNNGAGLQHIALKTDDIFATMRELKKRTYVGGFDFMPAPGQDYYDRIPSRIGENVLSAIELRELQDLGLLADRDDQGVLLQVFTKPLGDRPTVFIEIIQRIGCDRNDKNERISQAPGCGGFGKGNFGELFKSIEEYEKSLDVKA